MACFKRMIYESTFIYVLIKILMATLNLKTSDIFDTLLKVAFYNSLFWILLLIYRVKNKFFKNQDFLISENIFST